MHILVHDVKYIFTRNHSKILKAVGVMNVKDLIKLYGIILSSIF